MHRAGEGRGSCTEGILLHLWSPGGVKSVSAEGPTTRCRSWQMLQGTAAFLQPFSASALGATQSKL